MALLKLIQKTNSGGGRVTDAELIGSIADGNMAAFEELHGRYYKKLVHFCRRITGCAEAAEEVTDDSLMVVWRTAAKFQGKSKPSTWIFGIAYRQSLKQRQKLMRRQGDVDIDDVAIASDHDTETSVLLSRDLTSALARLSPELRAVVELTYYNGYIYTEIAEILGCPVGTVKTRMMTARRRLRHMLEDAVEVLPEHEVA